MVWSNCPDDSKKVKQMYVDLMLLAEVKDNASNFFRLHRFNIQNAQKFAFNFDYE